MFSNAFTSSDFIKLVSDSTQRAAMDFGTHRGRSEWDEAQALASPVTAVRCGPSSERSRPTQIGPIGTAERGTSIRQGMTLMKVVYRLEALSAR